jgi:LPS sulfotransferase NodH
LDAVRNGNGPIRAIILTTQRTGSTFLVECLQSHPEINCITELLVGAHLEPPAFLRTSRTGTKAARFLMSGGWFPTRAMRRFYASSDKPVSIFKAMYNQVSVPWTLRYLTRNTDIHVLHLSRRNLLKMHVSRLLMPTRRNRIWEPHTTEPLPPVTTRVDPAAALDQMRNAQLAYQHFEDLFKAHRRLPVVYEDLIENQRLRPSEGARICDFFGIAHHPMQSRLIKMNPESLKAMVTNYDELADVISRSEFASLLDPDSGEERACSSP